MSLRLDITTSKVMEILEKAKDETLASIPEDAPLVSYSTERIANHGVMQMFYSALQGIMDYEIRREEKGNDRMAGRRNVGSRCGG